MLTPRALCSLGMLLLACKAPEKKPKEERSDDPIARVASIEPALAKIRHLELESMVEASIQSADDFRAYVRREVEKDSSVGNRTEALVTLGLLPPSSNLGKAVEDAYATQAAAYYDPDAKRFFFVMVPESKDVGDVVTAHELTHALQDQHFGIKRYLTQAPNADARAARRFVTEGDAMLTSVAYLVYEKTHLAELSREQVAAMRDKFEEMANLDPSAMAEMLKQQAVASSHIDPQIQKSLDAMDSIPRTILVPLLDSYMKGAALALAAYQQGGWRAVDELYRDPPESTEQVLHPSERLLSGVDHPRRVTLPASFDGYTLVSSDVLGELQWSVYFSLWKHEGDGREEQNWDGDRYAILRSKEGKLVALVATIWDSEYDATLFRDAYLSTVKTRYGGKVTVDGNLTFVRHGDDATWVYRDKESLYIVDGGLDGDLVRALVDGTTFE